MRVQDCVFFQLTKASQVGAGFWAKRVEHLGVTASQALVLNFLGEEDRIPANILGRKLRIASPTMTGIVDRLEKMDLVERRPHPDDRRAILVCLTEKGVGCTKELNEIMVKANEDFLGRLSPKEAVSFSRLLRQIRMD